MRCLRHEVETAQRIYAPSFVRAVEAAHQWRVRPHSLPVSFLTYGDFIDSIVDAVLFAVSKMDDQSRLIGVLAEAVGERLPTACECGAP